MRHRTTSLLVVVALCMCTLSTEAAPDPYLQRQREKAASIAIGSGGVTRQQAELLAEAYFFSEVSGCGGPEAPQKRGQDWIVPVRVGYAGARNGALRIRASTGAVSYTGHPIMLPKDFARPRRD